MVFGLFSGVTIFLALIAGYLGIKLLGNTSWIMSWVRGTLGLCFIVLCILMGFVALDLYSYKQMMEEKPIATVSFEKLGDQHFKATFVSSDEGDEKTFELRGDQWQMDARVIRWLGFFSSLGAKPGYRLDRMSGRYYSLEDERRKERTIYELDSSEYGLDFWAWLKNNGKFLPWIDAVYGSATYLPMEDGAIYKVSLTHNGLSAKPLNNIADDAVNRWQ